MYALGVILFTLFFGTQPSRSLGTKTGADLAQYSQLTSGDPVQMWDFIQNFQNGQWMQYTVISQLIIETLARLLALNPGVRGDTEYLLNQDPFVRETVDVAGSQENF